MQINLTSSLEPPAASGDQPHATSSNLGENNSTFPLGGDKRQSTNHLQPKNNLDEESDIDELEEEEEENYEEDSKEAGSSPSASPSKRLHPKKERLRSLFLRYADLVDETGILAMKSRQYNRLLADSGIFDMTSKFNRVKADIIYSSHAKTIKGTITFDTFLNCLVKIAEIIYPTLAKQSRAKAFDRLITEKLLLFHDQVFTSSVNLSQPSLSVVSVVQGLVYDPDIKEILSGSFTVLKDIYDAYFSILARVDPEQLTEIASRQVVGFLKDFDLLGQFVQKQPALVMLDQLVNTPDEKLTNCEEAPAVFGDLSQDYGVHFTLARFFVFLSWVGIIGFDANKPEPEQYSPVEKVYFLLAKMELSEGFAAIYKYNPKATPTLMPPVEVSSQIIVNNPLDIKPRGKSRHSSSKKSLCSESMFPQVITPEEKAAVEVCTDKLQRIFMWYCSFSESANENKMPLSKFLLFIKDTGILVGSLESPESFKGLVMGKLTITEVELIFSKVIGLLNDKRLELPKEGCATPLKNEKIQKLYMDTENNKRAKMDFKAFYYAVTLIAEKIYPDMTPNRALIEFTEKNVRQLEDQNEGVERNVELLKEMFEILQNKNVAEALACVQNIVKVYFDVCTENMGVMDYGTFIKFCRDFEMFPDLCSKMVLHSTFYALAFINSRVIGDPALLSPRSFTRKLIERKTKSGTKVREYLDLPLFVEALALCAFQSKAFEKDTDPIERIVHLMQKVVQSPGVSIVKKMIGNTRIAPGDIDPLAEMKAKYPQYFERKFVVLHTEDAVAEAFADE